MYVLPLVLLMTAAPAQLPATPHATEACAVWEGETGFARSVAEHDAVAFAQYLDPGAVFIGGDDSAMHGRDAVAAGWSGLIEGKGLLMRWYPDAVDVSADGKLALSRGPFLIDNPALPDDRRYRIGRFISVWRKSDDGQWRVAFDGGGGNRPVPATPAEADALAAARRACPYR